MPTLTRIAPALALVGLACGLAALIPTGGVAPPPFRPRGVDADPTVRTTPAQDVRAVEERLIEGGLRRIAAAQNRDDGSFGGEDSKHVRIGLSAIACMALLADGNVEGRGRYHAETARAIKFLMSCSFREGDRQGYLGDNDVDTWSRMHGHGYATLALTQAYGMFGVQRRYASTSQDLRKVIHGAVDVIVRSQSRAGGWDYEPFDEVNDEGSITVCMLQALRGARNCGFHVPGRTIERALEYVRRSQRPDGSVQYRLHGNEQTSFELTAAACSTLAYGGAYYDKAVSNARDYLWNRKFDDFISHDHRYPYYGLYYAVQTLWFDYSVEGRRTMSRIYPRIVAWYREHWDPEAGVYRHRNQPLHKEMEYGDLYRTAFATLTLLISRQNLPIFQR